MVKKVIIVSLAFLLIISAGCRNNIDRRLDFTIEQTSYAKKDTLFISLPSSSDLYALTRGLNNRWYISTNYYSYHFDALTENVKIINVNCVYDSTRSN